MTEWEKMILFRHFLFPTVDEKHGKCREKTEKMQVRKNESGKR